MKLPVLASIALGGAAAIAGAVFLVSTRCSSHSLQAPVEAPADAGIEAWCASGLTPIEGGGCFAAPRVFQAPVPLLVYLHGRYAPKTVPEELVRQDRVARHAIAKGFAVLALRGLQGECTQEELADCWCWPSNPRNVDHGAAFFERFKPALAAARKRIGPGPNMLLGFSNGAYFAALIATRGFGPFDAITVAHGGPVQPTHAVGPTPPILLITADDDPSDGEMRQLDAELGREHWAHELVSREGGHALPDWDVDIALTFFTRARTERLPLAPALQTPRPRVVKTTDDAGGAPARSTESTDASEATEENPY